jgi:hypothetical protein
MKDLCTDKEVLSMEDFLDYYSPAINIAKNVIKHLNRTDSKKLANYVKNNDVEGERKFLLSKYNVRKFL